MAWLHLFIVHIKEIVKPWRIIGRQSGKQKILKYDLTTYRLVDLSTIRQDDLTYRFIFDLS